MLPAFTGSPESYLALWKAVLLWFLLGQATLLVILLGGLYLFVARPILYLAQLLR